MRSVRLQATPITEETFKRQKWRRHLSEDADFEITSEDDEEENFTEDDNQPYFFTLPLPKERIDRYSPMLISNSSHELEALVSMGLSPGQYFIEILDSDGLGYCTTEEELEILYKALTGKYIEE